MPSRPMELAEGYAVLKQRGLAKDLYLLQAGGNTLMNNQQVNPGQNARREVPHVESGSREGQSNTVHSADTLRYCFDDLAAGRSLVYIELQGTIYTLRRTRTGGLVLNK